MGTGGPSFPAHVLGSAPQGSRGATATGPFRSGPSGRERCQHGPESCHVIDRLHDRDPVGCDWPRDVVARCLPFCLRDHQRESLLGRWYIVGRLPERLR